MRTDGQDLRSARYVAPVPTAFVVYGFDASCALYQVMNPRSAIVAAPRRLVEVTVDGGAGGNTAPRVTAPRRRDAYSRNVRVSPRLVSTPRPRDPATPRRRRDAAAPPRHAAMTPPRPPPSSPRGTAFRAARHIIFDTRERVREREERRRSRRGLGARERDSPVIKNCAVALRYAKCHWVHTRVGRTQCNAALPQSPPI